MVIAKEWLRKFSKDTLNSIRSKQVARTVLAKEAEMVKNMMEEGLLSTKHAEEFLEEIGHDVARIEKQRNAMYREHATQSGKRFVERKYNIFSLGAKNDDSSNSMNQSSSLTYEPLISLPPDDDNDESKVW